MNRLTKTYRQLNNWINKYFFQISFSHLESEFLSNGQLLVICHYLEVTVTVFFFFSFFFFYQRFPSRTLTTHRTAEERRRIYFIPLNNIHPHTNIQTFICNFPCEMTITYFWSHRLYLPHCYSMRFSSSPNYRSKYRLILSY